MKKLKITRCMKEALYKSKIDPSDINIVGLSCDCITIMKDDKLLSIRY